MRPFSVLENTRFTNLFKGLDLLLHDYFPHTFCPETFTSEKQIEVELSEKVFYCAAGAVGRPEM